MRTWYAVLIGVALLMGLSAGVCQASPGDYAAEFAEVSRICVAVSADDPDGIISDPEGLQAGLTELTALGLEVALAPEVMITTEDVADDPTLILNYGVYATDGGYYGYVELRLWRLVTLSGVADPVPFYCVVYESEYSITGDGSPEDQIRGIAADLIDEFTECYLITIYGYAD